MQGTWRKARNGWVVVDVHGDEYVAENTMALLPIFEAMRQEDGVLNGFDASAPDPLGLLSSMRGAGLAIVKSGEQITDELGDELERQAIDQWEPEGDPGGAFSERTKAAQDAVDWPSTLPGPDSSTSAEAPISEPSSAGEPEYVPATEDGYEFPLVRGPLNGRREIKCPAHGWQTAVVKDGAYRCQHKPSPRQICQEPGTPKEEAEKRLVSA